MPFSFYEQNLSSDGSATVDLTVKGLKTGWVYELNSLVGWVDGSTLTQCSLGYVANGRFNIIRKRGTDNPFETVDWQGKINLKEGDKIRIRYHNTASGDKLYLWANGKMWRK